MKLLKIWIVTLFLLVYDPAFAQDLGSRTILPAGHSVWLSETTTTALRVTVNLRTQMLYVYSGDTLIAASSVSTGRDGYQTTQGHFTILGKESNHWSKKYKANMPWTMWINTSGEALHAGGDPGRPSSHGCVHMPPSFVAKLYTLMNVGDTVDVIDAEPELNLVM